VLPVVRRADGLAGGVPDAEPVQQRGRLGSPALDVDAHRGLVVRRLPQCLRGAAHPGGGGGSDAGKVFEVRPLVEHGLDGGDPGVGERVDPEAVPGDVLEPFDRHLGEHAPGLRAADLVSGGEGVGPEPGLLYGSLLDGPHGLGQAGEDVCRDQFRRVAQMGEPGQQAHPLGERFGHVDGGGLDGGRRLEPVEEGGQPAAHRPVVVAAEEPRRVLSGLAFSAAAEELPDSEEDPRVLRGTGDLGDELAQDPFLVLGEGGEERPQCDVAQVPAVVRAEGQHPPGGTAVTADLDDPALQGRDGSLDRPVGLAAAREKATGLSDPSVDLGEDLAQLRLLVVSHVPCCS